MANKSSSGISTPNGVKSVDEVKFNIQREENKPDRVKEFFELINNELRLESLSKSPTRNFTTYSKDKLRQYLKNPKANENNIRQLSKFLYRMCYAYRRLIWYNATMIDASAYSIIPLVDITKTGNAKKTTRTYYKTAATMQQLALDECILPILLTAWIEDTAYGYVYNDGKTFFIHVLDGQYCKVSAIDGGTLRYAFDFDYFRSRQEELQWWDSEFQDKYTAYSKGNATRWQELDYSREICLKVNIDDPTMAYPPYASLFESIIDLIDLQSIQSVKDELSIYKLLVARLKPLTGTNNPDDFEVDPRTALKYYQKLAASLPESVASCISPLPIDTIEFKPTDTSDVDMISKSTNNLFRMSGGSEVLSDTRTGTTITTAQIMADSMFAISSLLPQIEKWLNIYLDGLIGTDHAHVRFLKVTPYIRDTRKKQLVESAQNGVPTKLAIAAMDGFSPLETLSMQFFENDCLALHENWIPLQTSYTQSSGDGTVGAPTKDTDELSDSGEKTREADA